MNKRIIFDFEDLQDKLSTFELLEILRVRTGFDNEVILNRALRVYLEGLE